MQEHVDLAIIKLKALLKGKQDSWPKHMCTLVQVGEILEIIELLGSEHKHEENALGVREKDV